MSSTQDKLEVQLNDFDPSLRRQALEALLACVEEGSISLPEPKRIVNLHAHTCYSFNGYGYSPSYIAWRARMEGLYAIGIVDFDVLDAVDEFIDACALLGIRGTAGMESRVCVEALLDKEINSPGEPGISYHMGSGFVHSEAKADTSFLAQMKAAAQERNQAILDRVNAFLDPVTLDLDTDVLPLTPAANPTERHLCAAYQAKAEALYPGTEARTVFWSEKLGTPAEAIADILEDGPKLQALIRSKTMKKGGVGYIFPEPSSFPTMTAMNAFSVANGAIPTLTWLDGTTPGENDIERLFEVNLEAGAQAANVIPDRNWNIADPDIKLRKVAELDRFIITCEEHHLPVIIGTEMNAHGQRFVDDFNAPEMKVHADTFLRGANIMYGHMVLQRAAGMGYVSDWATRHFPKREARNIFFERVGRGCAPGTVMGDLAPDMVPEEMYSALQACAQK